MILIIDTSDSVNIFIALVKDKKVIFKKKVKAQYKQAEKLLPEIDKLLKLVPDKLKGISVVSGHGSFTALRIGVVTANTLGYGLKIPVVGVLNDEFKNLDGLVQKSIEKMLKAKGLSIVEPVYGSDFHSTKKK